MPQIRARDVDDRVRATRKLLLAAALIMCVLLALSSFATALLIPEQDYQENGPAAGRALAHLAHQLLGHGFGSIYDFTTIAILWFAGSSAMAGMLNLIPRYLPRFGMAPQWITYRRPLVMVLFFVSVIVTLIFDADVEAQGGAYATGVLVLMLSGCFAVALDLSRESRWLKAIYYWIIVAIFAYTLALNVIERTDGVIIASAFIASIVFIGAISRTWRSTELRVSDVTFKNDESARLWSEMIGKKVHAVPLRTSSARARHQKAREIRRFYRVDGGLAFLHVELVDNRSEFLHPLEISVHKESDDFVVEVTGAVAIANTIAFITELLDPKSVFLGLTRQNLMTQSLKYLAWGEGETGVMVYMILVRYWRSRRKDKDARPNIFIMSSAQ
jgi:hypothetical protein